MLQALLPAMLLQPPQRPHCAVPGQEDGVCLGPWASTDPSLGLVLRGPGMQAVLVPLHTHTHTPTR